jgi:hypothetical protein
VQRQIIGCANYDSERVLELFLVNLLLNLLSGFFPYHFLIKSIIIFQFLFRVISHYSLYITRVQVMKFLVMQFVCLPSTSPALGPAICYNVIIYSMRTSCIELWVIFSFGT